MRPRCAIAIPLLAALLSLSVLPVSCAPGRQDEERSSPGVPVLEEINRIGCVDCEGPELLSVLYMTMTADGTLWVLDRYEPFVRVFHMAGDLRVAFGTAGQGPGELGIDVQSEYVPGIALYPRLDGSILVHEAIPPVLTAFAATGEYTEELALEIPITVPRATTWDASLERLFMLSWLPGEGSRVDRFDLAGSPTVPAVPVFPLSVAFPPSDEEPPWPATPLSMAATSDGGFAIGDPWRYLIRSFDQEGGLVRQFERAIARPQKTEAEIRDHREILRQRAAALEEEAEEPHPEKSHFRHGAIDFDDEGRLWVATNRGAPGATVLDLFDPYGSFLGEVVLQAEIESTPETLKTFRVTGGFLAAVVLEESGDHRLGVWRVIWA